ncbi:MAG: DegT/DnrJ/EryC1/StrS family aminotransferase [Calditrichaceae bacterium]|nr:DegT/DnrJ/EryC1/StrS family aminotransferase [Calditrichaceae bacterium]MBN2710259.1 DegT/DnrJ/EryC1/StrS family aminotransferase [Calditrichaceae bacterium]RQV93882.1 MAG: DegT/DnrJ/EryC1/StrS family aminotransferase [Calditrichota bacterium]
MIPLIDLKAQYETIQEEMDQAVIDHIRSLKYINGPAVKEFEQAFALAHDVEYAIGCANGTAALHLAFEGLGIGKDDEVITTPMTFIATTEPLRQVGARAVFVDVDPVSYNLDPEKIEQAITPRTKAILAVHLHGNPCQLDRIIEIAEKHNLFVIEDCAQAHLAEFKGKIVGNFGHVSTFSFYPGKNLGAYGDAGMVVTNNEKLAGKIRLLVNHGRTEKYEHIIEGYNYRLDTIQAVVLNIKLKHLEEWTNKRIEKAKIYTGLLKDMDVKTPEESPHKKHVYHVYAITSAIRDKLAGVLKENGISTGIHYPIPLHLQPAYNYLGYHKGNFPVSERLANEFLSLPLYPELKETDINLICNLIKKCL